MDDLLLRCLLGNGRNRFSHTLCASLMVLVVCSLNESLRWRDQNGKRLHVHLLIGGGQDPNQAIHHQLQVGLLWRLNLRQLRNIPCRSFLRFQRFHWSLPRALDVQRRLLWRSTHWWVKHQSQRSRSRVQAGDLFCHDLGNLLLFLKMKNSFANRQIWMNERSSNNEVASNKLWLRVLEHCIFEVSFNKDLNIVRFRY